MSKAPFNDEFSADNPDINVHCDMINGSFDLSPETVAFMGLVRRETAALAKKLRESAPKTCNVGGFIVAVRELQKTKNAFCDAAITGDEMHQRKKRKAAETSKE